MPFPITLGYGSQGDGSGSGLASIQGLGSPGNATTFSLYLTEVYTDRIELVFSTNVQASGPALVPSQWVITTGVLGAPIPVVSSVVVAGPRIKLYYSEGRTGVLYSLAIPVVGVQDLSSNLFPGPFTTTFTGVGQPPFVLVAGSGDGFSVRVIFSEPVALPEATVATNYVITGGAGLTVFSVTQVNSQIYDLKTSLQVVGQTYTLTVSNIKDLLGNLI